MNQVDVLRKLLSDTGPKRGAISKIRNASILVATSSGTVIAKKPDGVWKAGDTVKLYSDGQIVGKIPAISSATYVV